MFLCGINSLTFRLRIRMVDSGIDTESGISWCSYIRPQRPETELDLDLTEKLYHFYFRGEFGPDSTSIVLPLLEEIQKSSYRFNITEAYNDIRYTGNVAGAGHYIKPILYNIILIIIALQKL